MNSEIWGRELWHSLHIITFNYPVDPTNEDKINYDNFFKNIQFIIPCIKCQKHYRENLVKYPIRLNTKIDLIKWLIDIHNEVNISLNKKILNYDEAMNIYTNLINQNKRINVNQEESKCFNYITKIIITLIVFIIIYLLRMNLLKYLKKKKIYKY